MLKAIGTESPSENFVEDVMQSIRAAKSATSEMIYKPLISKLGWLLIILNQKDFTNTSEWSKIKEYINSRNYLIHYKPDKGDKHDKHIKNLTPKKIKIFFDMSDKCEEYLKKSRTKKFVGYSKKINNIKKYMNKRFKEQKEVYKKYNKDIRKLEKKFKHLKKGEF